MHCVEEVFSVVADESLQCVMGMNNGYSAKFLYSIIAACELHKVNCTTLDGIQVHHLVAAITRRQLEISKRTKISIC